MVTASGAYWVLKWPVTSLDAPVSASVANPSSEPQSLARLLGRDGADASAGATVAPAIQAPSRFVLTGVVADAAKGGAALIALDGQASKPYRVGASVADGLVLQSVAARRAVLAPALNAPAALMLEMKPLDK